MTVLGTEVPWSLFRDQQRAAAVNRGLDVPAGEGGDWFLLQDSGLAVDVSTRYLEVEIDTGVNPAEIAGQAGEGAPTADPRAVFVVHGRDAKAQRGLFAFLRSIDLHPLEWEEGVALTNTATPYVGEVLDAAFSRAQAIVVLMTPDDRAVLKEVFRGADDRDYESNPTGQARPNVLFEAGMALGRHPRRTVLVELGHLRPFSDVGGRHIVRLDNSPERRKALAQRLEAAGCPVNLEGDDWLTIGSLEATESAVGIMIESLHSIDKHPGGRRVFSSFGEALPVIRELMEEEGEFLSVDVLAGAGGVTVHQITGLFKKCKAEQIAVRIHLVAPNTPVYRLYPDHWQQEVKRTLHVLDKTNWTEKYHVVVRTHLTIAGLRGVVINRRHAFIGVFQWEDYISTGEYELQGSDMKHVQYDACCNGDDVLVAAFLNWSERFPEVDEYRYGSALA